MQLNLPLHKGHILVKRGNSNMNGVYTEFFFYIHQKGFWKSHVSVLPFEVLSEIYTSRLLLMLSYLPSVHLAESFIKTFSGSCGQFSRKICLEELFSRKHFTTWFCKNELHSSVVPENFRNSKKPARFKSMVCRPAIF